MYQVFEVLTGKVIRTVRSVQAAQSVADVMTENASWTRSNAVYDYRAA